MRFHMLQAAKKLSIASFIFHLGTNWSQSVIFQTGMKTNSFFSLPYIFTEIACEKFNLHYIKHKNIAFAKKSHCSCLL